MAELSVAQIAELVGGRVHGDASLPIRGVAPLEKAGPRDLSFVANPRYLRYLQETRAGAVLLPEPLSADAPEGLTRIVVADPHVALYRVLPRLYPRPEHPASIHPTAVVDPGAHLGSGVSLGPYVVIEAGARIGDRTRIGAHTVVGERCRVGSDCEIHPHVTLYHAVVVGDRCVIHSGARVGREGFGFVWAEGGHRRIPQVGGCVLEDDVEIGANCCVDRGSIGDTVVGAGTKIDNLVQLGHNVRTGQHVILVSQVGVAGSTLIEDGAVLGGQAGVSGHLTIGARARVGAQAGVIGDLPGGETYSGYPARPHREALRQQGALARVPELLRRVRELEKRVLDSAE